MRALEQELNWTFPAIKKQIDSLDISNVIKIDKENQARSIQLHEGIAKTITQLVLITLKQDCEKLLGTYEYMIS